MSNRFIYPIIHAYCFLPVHYMASQIHNQHVSGYISYGLQYVVDLLYPLFSQTVMYLGNLIGFKTKIQGLIFSKSD